MTQSFHRWTRILLPIRSIQSLMIVLACIAALLGSYIHRRTRSDLQKKHRSLELWHEVYAKANISRLDEKSKIVPKLNFRYPFAIDFRDRDNADDLFALIPICDSLRAIRWIRTSLSEEEAKQISTQHRCRSLQFSLTQNASAMMPHLGKMSGLQELSFDRSLVTQRDIELLCQAKQLKILIFSATNVTRDQIHFLRESLPATYVICMDWK